MCYFPNAGKPVEILFHGCCTYCPDPVDTDKVDKLLSIPLILNISLLDKLLYTKYISHKPLCSGFSLLIAFIMQSQSMQFLYLF